MTSSLAAELPAEIEELPTIDMILISASLFAFFLRLRLAVVLISAISQIAQSFRSVSGSSISQSVSF